MKKLCLVAVLAMLTACGSDRSGAEDAVRTILKDPESARFGEIYYNEFTKKGCLTVNAKNSIGGYTGDQQAFIRRTEQGWEATSIAEIDQEGCRQVHADQAR